MSMLYLFGLNLTSSQVGDSFPLWTEIEESKGAQSEVPILSRCPNSAFSIPPCGMGLRLLCFSLFYRARSHLLTFVRKFPAVHMADPAQFPVEGAPPEDGPQQDVAAEGDDRRLSRLPAELPEERDPLAPDEPLSYPSAPQVGPDDFPRRQRDPTAGRKHSCCLMYGTSLNDFFRTIPTRLRYDVRCTHFY